MGHKRRVALAVIGFAAVIAMPTASFAAPAVTDTQHFTTTDGPSPDVNPCTGAPGLFGDAGKLVVHETDTAKGGVAFTGTFVGTAAFVSSGDPRDNAAGKTVGWFGGTISQRGTSQDGGTFSGHLQDGWGHHISEGGVFHETFLANGTLVVTVDRNRLTCTG